MSKIGLIGSARSGLDLSFQEGLLEGFVNEILVLVSAPLVAHNEKGQLLSLEVPIDIMTEIEGIKYAIETARDATDVETKFILNIQVATAKNLKKAFLRSHKPLIIHLIGHGALSKAPGFLIENEDGKAIPLTPDFFESMLRSLPENIPCQLLQCLSVTLPQVFQDSND